MGFLISHGNLIVDLGDGIDTRKETLSGLDQRGHNQLSISSRFMVTESEHCSYYYGTLHMRLVMEWNDTTL